MEPVKGVDISEFDGSVDIQTLKNAGVKFVIIRCGYGSDYTSQDDIRYSENVQKCEQAGIPYGVYLYSYAKSQANALSEAQHTIRLLKNAKPTYGVWYDVEDDALPYGETLITNCIAYCEAIENAGYYCGIYASLSFWQNRLDDSRLNVYDKWVAQWSSQLDYTGDFGIWQYSDSGDIGGKTFDMNLAYKDYPAITGGDDTDMTKDEVAALARSEAQKVYDENETKYKTIATTPDWVKSDILKVYQVLQLAGTGTGFDGENTEIDAGTTYLRLIKIISSLLDKMDSEQEKS